jgi:hypothetical protein
VPGSLIVLEVYVAPLPGYVGQGAPPRFVLMEDGGVYVGGTRNVMVGLLGSDERKALEKRIGEIRKLPLTGVVSIGPGVERRRMILGKGRPIEMVLTGDPARPSTSMKSLAAFVQDLERFQHPSLRPFTPTSYSLSAREGKPLGGCRPWTLPDPLLESVFAPRVVPAKGLGDWPTGANPATVCHQGKTYVVTFRPMLPGETP